MADDIRSLKKNINEQNKKFDSEFSNEDLKEKNKISRLNNILSSINIKRSSSSNGNILDFYTSIEMNKSNNINNNLGFINNNNISKKEINNRIEENIKNYMQNVDFEDDRQRFSRYEDYRLIDAYIPELAHCLDVYRDTILSPDDITKKSLNYLYKSKAIPEDLEDIFNKNIKELEKKYKLPKLIKEEIRNALRDGDLFSIIIPLNEAFSKILKENHYKDDLFPNEEEDEFNGVELNESFLDFSDNELNCLLEDIKINSNDKDKEKRKIIKNIKKNIVNDINNHVKFYENPLDLLSQNKEDKEERQKIDDDFNRMKGSFFHIPKPESMINLEIDDICFGYIYLEKNQTLPQDNLVNGSFFGNVAVGTVTSSNNGYFGNSNDIFDSRYDFVRSGNFNNKIQVLTDIFVRGISKKINKKTIVDNQEFKNVIYTLLRNNYILENDIKITFLQPDYVYHFKTDSNNTYGISRLAKSLFFAKLYLSVLLTSILTKISRGKDRRAFYVDVGMDEDFEGTVQSLIRDIKSKEVTANSMKDISTILNVVGSYEDFYIPTLNGDKPFEIDTIPGQQVDINDDLIEFLLKSTISGTGIPLNYIDATNDVDFARSLAMQNSGFVRSIVSYQNDFGDYWTEVIQKLYKNEFYENSISEDNVKNKKENKKDSKKDKNKLIDFENIEISFPAPIYLSLTNLNEQVSNISQMVDFITNLYFNDNSDDEDLDKKKLLFRKNITKEYLSTSMDWELFDSIFEKTCRKINEEKLKDKAFPKEENDDQM